MMAYVQILAIVLCSCFIQDVFSITKATRVTSVPAKNEVALQSTKNDDQVAPKSPLRRITTLKRTVSKKVPATPSLPPPPKYPHLTAVKDMFWNTFEDINRADVNGKLNTRAARNLLGNVLSNEMFWLAMVTEVKRQAKVTNDSRRADGKIRVCNMLTTAITSPNAMQVFQDVANDVYGTFSRMQPNAGTDNLRAVTEMVNEGEVTRGLGTITNIVNHINLNPRMLIKGFNLIHKTLIVGGTININGGLAKGIMTFSSKLNK